MADELNIKFSGDTAPLEASMKRVTGQLSTLNSTVERTGDDIKGAFSRDSRKAIDQMRAATRRLKREVKELRSEEVKQIKTSVSMVKVLTKLRTGFGAAREAFRLGAQAVGSFVSGILDAITTSEEFIAELEGIDTPLFNFSQSTREALQTVNEELRTTTAISKLLSVQLAAEFAPSVGTVATAASNLGLAYGKVNKKLLDVTDGQKGLGFVLADFVSGGTLTKISNAAGVVNLALSSQADELAAVADGYADVEQKASKLTSSLEKFEKGLSQIGGFDKKAYKEQLDATDKITFSYQMQIEEVKRLSKELGGLNLTSDQRIQLEEKTWAALTQIQAAMLHAHDENNAKKDKAAIKAAEARAKAIIEIAEHETSEVMEAQKAGEEEAAEKLAVSQALMEETVAVFGAALGETSERIGAALDAAEGKSRVQLKRLFAAQKATAMAEAVISGAMAAQRALAFPPGPPATLPMAAMVGTMAAVNVATIAAEAPPFHIGTRVSDLASDEMRITRREGLAVLTPQGISSGGAEAVADANAGIRQDTPTTVVFQYDHRMFDATIEDNVNRVGSPLGRLIRDSRYGHRRRNG